MKINKKSIIAMFFLVGILFSLAFIFSADITYCCEKTTNGAWCQNSAEENCDASYRATPSSCESTSYCKLGTCYDSQEGTCIENTPERVCEDDGGVWEDADPEDLPQCSLGCCLVGNQAAFVTQTRCKRLSSLYGVETNFRLDLSSELECISSATSDIMGACVFTQEYEVTCLMATQAECKEIQTEVGDTEFHKDYLCSAESLGTNCGPTEDTTCVEGEDEVYFLDTCGNLANIYDGSKINDDEYWSKIKTKAESCNPTSSNANSASCGNCDYYLGSTCKEYKRSEDDTKPSYGESICRDLSCEYKGKKYEHGETWCADSSGTNDNLPGSRHFRLICYNGDVTVEPCADYRQETCIESSVNGFSSAACSVNKWQDCTSQTDQDDCTNTDKRDCMWLSIDGGKCVPQFTPGFDFWTSDSNAKEICSTASKTCTVVYEEGLFGDKECVENCECLDSSWKDQQNQICTSLGDCGEKSAYL